MNIARTGYFKSPLPATRQYTHMLRSKHKAELLHRGRAHIFIEIEYYAGRRVNDMSPPAVASPATKISPGEGDIIILYFIAMMHMLRH